MLRSCWTKEGRKKKRKRKGKEKKRKEKKRKEKEREENLCASLNYFLGVSPLQCLPIQSVLFVMQLQLGVDESYSLLVAKNDDHSIIGEATIEVTCDKNYLVLAHI